MSRASRACARAYGILFKPRKAFMGTTFVFGKEFDHLVVGEAELGQRCQASIHLVRASAFLVHDRSVRLRATGAFNMSG